MNGSVNYLPAGTEEERDVCMKPASSVSPSEAASLLRSALTVLWSNLRHILYLD